MWSVGLRGRGEVDVVSAHPVLVVGAGPVGLAAALALRARGLPATVVEAEPEARPRPGSRAIFVHRESLELLERVRPGLGWELAAEGLVWSTKRTFWGDREVYARTYPPGDPSVLPHSTNLPQVATERLLQDACKAAGVEFLWDAAVTGVAVTPDGVELTTAPGDRLQAPYVIGADGARSAVRREIGVTMEGSLSRNSFVIVDVEECADDPLPLERRFYYGHPAVGRRNVLLVPFAGGWRVDLQCHQGDDPERFNDPLGRPRALDLDLPVPPGGRLRPGRPAAARPAGGRGGTPVRPIRRPRDELGDRRRDGGRRLDRGRAGRRGWGRGRGGGRPVRRPAARRRGAQPRRRRGGARPHAGPIPADQGQAPSRRGAGQGVQPGRCLAGRGSLRPQRRAARPAERPLLKRRRE